MKDQLINYNIHNLTSFWKAASIPLQSYHQTPNHDYCEVEDSDWPNRLWFKQAINNSTVEIVRQKLENSRVPLIVPIWENEPSIKELLAKNGFSLLFSQAGMSFKPSIKFAVNKQIQIKLVSNDNDATLFESLYPQAFGYRIGRKVLQASWDEIEYYLVFHQNQAIGTAIVFQTDQVTGIHGVGVIPEMRKKGFAEEIMKQLINRAIDLNSEYVTLQASEMGINIYLKLGFHEQFALRNYVLVS